MYISVDIKSTDHPVWVRIITLGLPNASPQYVYDEHYSLLNVSWPNPCSIESSEHLFRVDHGIWKFCHKCWRDDSRSGQEDNSVSRRSLLYPLICAKTKPTNARLHLQRPTFLPNKTTHHTALVVLDASLARLLFHISCHPNFGVINVGDFSRAGRELIVVRCSFTDRNQTPNNQV